MHWKQYEKQLFAYFKSHYPEANITFDAKRTGRYSKKERQIDILVEDTIADYPVTLVVDAKYYGRKIDVKNVESFISMIEDLDAHQGLMITSKGFTRAAINRAYYGPKKLELDIISFAELSEKQGLLATAYSGNRGILLCAPIGWVIDPMKSNISDPLNNDPWLATLYQRGRSLKDAQKEWEWIYVNIWELNESIKCIDDLVAKQNTDLQRSYNEVNISLQNGPKRKDNLPTKIRIAEPVNLPFMEVTGYIQEVDFIVFFVLFTYKELFVKNNRKLGFLLKYSEPANISFDNTKVIEKAIIDLETLSDDLEKGVLLWRIAVWYSEMKNEKLALEFHRKCFKSFPGHVDNLRRLIGHELLFGNHIEAIQASKHLFRNHAKNPRVFQILIDPFLSLRRGDLLVNALDELILEFADYPEELGNLYYHKGALQQLIGS